MVEQSEPILISIPQVPSVFEEMILSGITPDRKARAMLRSALKYMKQALR